MRVCWIITALARPRYLALTLSPFLIGELWSGGHDNVYLALGTLQILLLRIVSSIGNCVSDQVEDARDHPRRVGYCQEIGYLNLQRVVAAAVGLYMATLIYMAVVLRITLLAAGLWTSYLAIKISYSFGPRLKPRRFVSTLLLGSLSSGMFIAGWFGLHVQWDNTAAYAALLIWVGASSLGGSKDAPNLTGDATIGYQSPILRVMNRRQPAWVTASIAGLPFFLAAGIAGLTGNLRFLAPICSAPLAILFVRVLLNAESTVDLELIRELGYAYWIAFMGTLLIAVSSVGHAALLIMALTGAWYVVASWILHPDETALTYRGMRRALAVASGRAGASAQSHSWEVS